MSAASSCPAPRLHSSESTMENLEENNLSKLKLLETPTTGDSCVDDEDVKSAIMPRFSPLPRRRSSVSSDEGELEPPTSVARKVSFADAFGFDLVSVKEFDTWEVPTISQDHTFELESTPIEEFFLTPSFVLPSSDGIMENLYTKKVLLESVDFLPRTTCMKGIIRVLNMSYEKQVYVRMSLDNWQSYYDLLAEYVPDSCNGDTDQFFFNISLVAPYQNDGAKVEFCICFETPVGTFWDSNDGQNYILICHKKEQVVETDKLTEDFADKYKKSCLKPSLSKEEDEEVDMLETKKSGVTEPCIPRIICSHCDHKEHKKEEEVDKSGEQNTDAENNLELFLSQHFAKTRNTSSEDELNNMVDGRPIFQTEKQIHQSMGYLENHKAEPLTQQLNEHSTSNNVIQEAEELMKTDITPGVKKTESLGAEQFGSISADVIKLEVSTNLQKETQGNEIIKLDDSPLTEHFTELGGQPLEDIGPQPGNETIEKLILNKENKIFVTDTDNTTAETASFDKTELLQLTGHLDNNANPHCNHSYFLPNNKEWITYEQATIPEYRETENNHNTTYMSSDLLMVSEALASKEEKGASLIATDDTNGKLSQNWELEHGYVTHTLTGQGTEQDKKHNVDNHKDTDFTLLQMESVPTAKTDSTTTYYDHSTDCQNYQELHSFQDNDREITTDQKEKRDMHRPSKVDKITGREYESEEIFQIADTLKYNQADNTGDLMSHKSNEISEIPPYQGMFREKVIIVAMTEEKSHSEIHTQDDDHRVRCYLNEGDSESNKLTEQSYIGIGPPFQMVNDLEGNSIIDPGVHTDLFTDEIVDNDLSIDEKTEDIESNVMASTSILNCFCEENIICELAKDDFKDQPQSYRDKICSNVTATSEGVSSYTNINYSNTRSGDGFSEEFIDDIGAKREHVAMHFPNENRVYESAIECMSPESPERPLVDYRTPSKDGKVNIDPDLGEMQTQTLGINEQCKLGYQKQNQEPLPEKVSESDNISSDPLSINNVSSKVVCFIMFIVFAGLMYHYDFLVCFALYLFSLYWLYWEGDRNKKPLKKE